MTLSVTYDGDELADAVRFFEGVHGLITNADGGFESAEVQVEDEPDTRLLVPWQYLIAEESACSQPRMWTGFLFDQTQQRDQFRADGSRNITAQMQDLNALLHQQVATGASAKRPQESFNARIAWLLGSRCLNGLVFDNGMIDSTTDLLDEADYTNQYADAILPDLCVTSSGVERIFFVYWDPVAEQPSLFLSLPTSTLNSSTLRLSNVQADVDNSVTFYPWVTSELDLAAEDIYCAIWFKYKTGTVYRHNDTTHNAFFANGFHREMVYETTRVGSVDTATRHADGILAAHAGNTARLTCDVTLPATHVNLIEAGMRVECKFVHLDGLHSFTWMRVGRRTVTINPDAAERMYDLHLELSNKGILAVGGGGTGGFPNPGGCTDGGTSDFFAGVTTANLTAGSDGQWTAGTAGSHPSGQFFAPLSGLGIGSLGSGAGWGPDVVGGPTTYRRWIEVDLGEPRGLSSWTSVMDLDGLPRIYANSAPMPPINPARDWTGAPYPTPLTQGWTEILGTWSPPIGGGGGGGTFTFTPTTAPTAAYRYWALESDMTTGGLGTGGENMQQWDGLGCVGGPPASGQWVYGETPTPPPDGATATFFTQFPFADGSLRVWVDNLDQTAAVTSFDGATGSFTLGFDPWSTDVLKVDYQGR